MYYDYQGGAGHTVVGDLKVIPGVASPQLGNQRDLLVLLPAGYRRSRARYPVLYMHDGQNLFDARASYAGEWQVDETLALLEHQGLRAIVVGIPNAGAERINEYAPFRDARVKAGGHGKQYLAWIVETVKPLIDSTFRTRPDRRSTALIGSSMGGLISLYGFFQHPQVFGICGALSPSLWFSKPHIFPAIRRAPFVEGTIYLDSGTAEGFQTLENARAMRLELLAKGYREGRSLVYVEQEGAGHNEAAWAGRLRRVLPQLLKKPAK